MFWSGPLRRDHDNHLRTFSFAPIAGFFHHKPAPWSQCNALLLRMLQRLLSLSVVLFLHAGREYAHLFEGHMQTMKTFSLGCAFCLNLPLIPAMISAFSASLHIIRRHRALIRRVSTSAYPPFDKGWVVLDHSHPSGYNTLFALDVSPKAVRCFVFRMMSDLELFYACSLCQVLWGALSFS